MIAFLGKRQVISCLTYCTIRTIYSGCRSCCGCWSPRSTHCGRDCRRCHPRNNIGVCICCCISAICSCRVAISVGGFLLASCLRPSSLWCAPGSTIPVSGGHLRLSSLLRWHSRTLSNAHRTVLGTTDTYSHYSTRSTIAQIVKKKQFYHNYIQPYQTDRESVIICNNTATVATRLSSKVAIVTILFSRLRLSIINKNNTMTVATRLS